MKKAGLLMSLFLSLGLVLFSSGCGKDEVKVLKMATTTSTADTGLLDYLMPKAKDDIGIEVQYIAVGTGKALEYGRNCDVDILMVHAPASEKEFIDNGHGTYRREIMYNDFVIIGPASDSASIKGKSIKEAFNIINKKGVNFASRGDDSGTHKKELSLWKDAGLKVPDKQKWYIQTGQGMMNTITIAEERDACTMTDRGTYIKYAANKKDNPPLVILIEGDPTLLNQYSVIPINPDKCKGVKNDLAEKFTEWIVSPDIQKVIADFRLMDKQLFFPNAK